MEPLVVLRLCDLLWYEASKIRVIIGLCSDHYSLKERWFFKKTRPTTVPISFRPSKLAKYTLDSMATGEKYTFSGGTVGPWLFLNKCLTEGIYQWTVQVDYGPKKSSIYMCCAPSTPELLNRYENREINRIDGLFFLTCSENNKPSLPQLFGNRLLCYPGPDIPNNSLVTVEVDLHSRIVSFLAEGKKLPMGVAGVDGPVHIGISGNESSASVTPASFRRLQHATPFPAKSVLYNHRPKPISTTAAAADYTVRVHIKHAQTGKSIDMDVCLLDTVESLKRRLATGPYFQSDATRLIYAGAQLDDERILNDCNIQRNAIIHSVFRLGPGG